MSASFPKLTRLIKEQFPKAKLIEGDLFLFVNQKLNYLKLMYYHAGGLCLFAKYLPSGQFSVWKPGKAALTHKELQVLVDHVVNDDRRALKAAA